MKRILELDYLKGILILLVISFHLVYFEQLYPFIKQVVYTFHMPGFLLISGYLMNVSKQPKDFLRTLLWLAIPYIIMESGYIYMASLLPINEHIDHLTPAVFLDRLLLHPLGPYWYLHTLIICGAIYYLIHNSHLIIHNSLWGKLGEGLIIGLAYFSVFYVLGTLLPLKGVGGSFSFSSALYFLAGAAIHQSGMKFLSAFSPLNYKDWGQLYPCVLAFLIIFLYCFPHSWILKILIVYFAIATILWDFHWHNESKWLFIVYHIPLAFIPKGIMRSFIFLGRNSLVLYVFSPIFTILCKRFVPYLQFDHTGLIFLMVSLAFCVAGCLAIAWMMDLTGISRFFFGKKAIN